jgi:hypothetical protein
MIPIMSFNYFDCFQSKQYSKENSMDWIKSRLVERTSWDGAALVAVGLVVLFLGAWATYAAWAAVVWGAWTMWTKDK